MHPVVVRVALDIGGAELARLATGLAFVVGFAVLLALALPLALLAMMLPGATPGRLPVAPGSVVHAAPVLGANPTLNPLPVSAVGSDPVEVARRYLGVPYVFGGTNPAVGLDCSGLVQLVFRQVGVNLPRTAQQQYDATVHIPRDQLQPGDLVFFARTYAHPNDWITHVGIYIGGGQQINAPTTGQVVSIQPVFTGFWGAHFASGGRVVRA
jgi:cell wall-associated NlpC family hydrolase